MVYGGQYTVVLNGNVFIIFLAKSPKTEATPVSSGTPQAARKKKVSAIRMLSGQKRRDILEVQDTLRGCVNTVTKMMKLPLMSEKKVR